LKKSLRRSCNCSASDPGGPQSELWPSLELNEVQQGHLLHSLWPRNRWRPAGLWWKKRPDGFPSDLSNEYWVIPTVFSDWTDTMNIVKEEILGPVMPILTYENVNKATAQANGTSLGLAEASFRPLNPITAKVASSRDYIDKHLGRRTSFNKCSGL
jgi:hypothetical protein